MLHQGPPASSSSSSHIVPLVQPTQRTQQRRRAGVYWDKMLDPVRHHLADLEVVGSKLEDAISSLQRVYCVDSPEGAARKFVIGITRDPDHRFGNSSYGYKRGAMYVLYRAPGPESAAELERALIGHFRGMISSKAFLNHIFTFHFDHIYSK